MNKSLLKGPTTKTIMLDYLSCLFLQNLHGSHAAQALAEIVYLCDNCSFVLFSLAYDWQNFGEWWITMSIVYLALVSFSAVSHIVMYDLITGQVLSLLELPLRIAAWMVQVDVLCPPPWKLSMYELVVVIVRLQTALFLGNCKVRMMVQLIALCPLSRVLHIEFSREDILFGASSS
jgi:hypothetical protein